MNSRTLSTLSAFSLLLAACSFNDQLVQPTNRSPIPADLLLKCQQLPEPNVKTMGDLLEFSIGLTDMYAECAIRHNRLSRFLRSEEAKK